MNTKMKKCIGGGGVGLPWKTHHNGNNPHVYLVSHPIAEA